MANTTNYNWETPDDTDLVKDGALAIRTLGSSVDTTTKALNPSTTLGDIEYRSATANTNTRLGIGSTGNVLTVAGGVPSWAAPASGGGMTQLATGSLTGSTLTISDINQTYQDLRLVLAGVSLSTADNAQIRINGVTTLYNSGGFSVSSSTVAIQAGDVNSSAWTIALSNYPTAANTNSHQVVYFPNYTAASSYKGWYGWSALTTDGSTSRSTFGAGSNFVTGAITSMTIKTGSGDFDSGTYTLYGVK